MPENLMDILKALGAMMTLVLAGLGGSYIGRRKVRQGEAQDAVLVREAKGEIRLLDRQEDMLAEREAEIKKLTDKAGQSAALSVKVEMMSAQLVRLENEHNLELARINQLHVDRINDFRKELDNLRVLVLEKEKTIQEKDELISRLQAELIQIKFGAPR